MKKIVLLALFLQCLHELSAQKLLLLPTKNELVFQKKLPSIGFKSMPILKYQEAITREVLPTFNQKIRFEKAKIDSNALSIRRVQNLYYRMKMWYAFQTKNKNGMIFKGKTDFFAKI